MHTCIFCGLNLHVSKSKLNQKTSMLIIILNTIDLHRQIQLALPEIVLHSSKLLIPNLLQYEMIGVVAVQPILTNFKLRF